MQIKQAPTLGIGQSCCPIPAHRRQIEPVPLPHPSGLCLWRTFGDPRRQWTGNQTCFWPHAAVLGLFSGSPACPADLPLVGRVRDSISACPRQLVSGALAARSAFLPPVFSLFLFCFFFFSALLSIPTSSRLLARQQPCPRLAQPDITADPCAPEAQRWSPSR